MPIPFADQMVPNGPFPIVEDSDVKGGFRSVADNTERNNIPLVEQKVGMHIYVVSTGTTWILTATSATPIPDSNFRASSGLQLLSGAKSTGSITVDASGSGAVNVLDLETFTIDDGTNPPVVFSFDTNGVYVETPTFRRVDVVSATTAADVSAAIASAINSAPTLNVDAIDDGGGSGYVSLRNTVSGPSGNVAITETVVNGNFTVGGMSGGSAGRSYLIQGLELIPAINRVFSGGTYYTCPQFRVRPGVMSFPNGRVGSVDSSLVLNLRSGATLGTVVDSLWGDDNPYFSNSLYNPTGNYAFYLFLRYAPADSSVVLTWSQFPPDESGRPRHYDATSPPAPLVGTADDYAYVGMLLAQDDLYSSPSSESTQRLMSKIWGGCSVITFGNGVREVGIGQRNASYIKTMSGIVRQYANGNFDIGTADFTALLDPVNIVPGNDGLFGRCRAVRMDIQIGSKVLSTDDFGSFDLQAPFASRQFPAGITTTTITPIALFETRLETIPVLWHTQKTSSYRVKCSYLRTRGGGGGNEVEVTSAYAKMVSVIEDVNNLQSTEYSQTAWPDET